MTKFLIALAAGGVIGAGAHAQEATGDAAAGEGLFSQCQACHTVADEEGNVLAGGRAKTGPNLYGVAGRQAGSVEDFRYSDAIVEAGEGGLNWDEESFVAYVQDPTGFLRDHLGDSSARGKMTYRVRSEEDALNVYAFLASLGSGEDEEEGEEKDSD